MLEYSTLNITDYKPKFTNRAIYMDLDPYVLMVCSETAISKSTAGSTNYYFY
jgi:hypothetical protein